MFVLAFLVGCTFLGWLAYQQSLWGLVVEEKPKELPTQDEPETLMQAALRGVLSLPANQELQRRREVVEAVLASLPTPEDIERMGVPQRIATEIALRVRTPHLSEKLRIEIQAGRLRGECASCGGTGVRESNIKVRNRVVLVSCTRCHTNGEAEYG